MPLFNRHHYNVLAKEIRERYEIPRPAADSEYVTTLVRGRNTGLSSLVLHLCERFAADNPLFESVRFTEAAIPKEIREDLIKEAMYPDV